MVKRYSISQGVDPYPDVFVMASDYDALEAELAGCKQQLAVAPSYAKMIAHHGRQEQRIATLETVLRGLLDAFETDQIDDFTAYDEPIPSAVHAARAALECSPSDMNKQFEITWVDSGREPKCAPNPDYPAGIDLPNPPGPAACRVELPYPAKRCGVYIVKCARCQVSIAVTTAGRADDPRSCGLPCGETLQ
jgi:hypothetical protein